MERTAIIFMALIALGPAPSNDAVVKTDSPAQVSQATVLRGATSSQTASVDWALGRFEDAGIPLPTLEIRVHGSRAGCDDNDGLFTPRDGVDTIDLCSDVPLILLHELGHAWDVTFATDDTRRMMLDAWGSDRWSGSDVSYRQRDAEKAANLIALGLVDSPLTESEARASRGMLQRFEMLTGVPSPRFDGTVPDVVLSKPADTAGLAAQYSVRAAPQVVSTRGTQTATSRIRAVVPTERK
ncbi:MAG: hypothetical protein M3132_06635 [Actinomycetia bacterium]|nr:hypothetical protein [Actinomycetes bacterium]